MIVRSKSKRGKIGAAKQSSGPAEAKEARDMVLSLYSSNEISPSRIVLNH